MLLILILKWLRTLFTFTYFGLFSEIPVVNVCTSDEVRSTYRVLIKNELAPTYQSENCTCYIEALTNGTELTAKLKSASPDTVKFVINDTTFINIKDNDSFTISDQLEVMYYSSDEFTNGQASVRLVCKFASFLHLLLFDCLIWCFVVIYL